MELTVVIPCFNASATLGLQLEALARQVDPPTFEVIVVDNGSPLAPEAVVEQWRERLTGLRLVSAGDHQGTSYARNVGIAQAVAPLIVFADADDVAGPHFLRAAVEALAQVEVVTGDVQPVDSSVFDGGVDGVWAALADRTREPDLAAVDLEAPDVTPGYPTLMGGACGFRAGVLRDLDGWDQGFFPGAEDNDLGLRVLEGGFSMGKSWSMTLAERRRATAAQMFKRSFDSGAMHMRLCQAHDLWSVSPHLNHPRWWQDLLKLPAVAVKTVLTDRSPQTVQNLLGRIGLRCGQAQGFWHYRVRGHEVQPLTGIGLDPGGRAVPQAAPIPRDASTTQ